MPRGGLGATAAAAGGGARGGRGGRSGGSFFERTNHAVLVVGWGVEGTSGAKYWWAQNTWGDGWGDGGYFRMARGGDDSAFESMAVAVDVEGSLPLPMQRRLKALDDAYEPVDGGLRRAEARRVAALRRRPEDTTHALAPEGEPPPSPKPRYAWVEEPRDRTVGLWSEEDQDGEEEAAAAPADSGTHHSLLDAIAHWRYGGG